MGSGQITTFKDLYEEGIAQERIDEILAEKRMLFETIFSGTRPAGNLGLSQQELFGLFNLQRPGAADAAARHAA